MSTGLFGKYIDARETIKQAHLLERTKLIAQDVEYLHVHCAKYTISLIYAHMYGYLRG